MTSERSHLSHSLSRGRTSIPSFCWIPVQECTRTLGMCWQEFPQPQLPGGFSLALELSGTAGAEHSAGEGNTPFPSWMLDTGSSCSLCPMNSPSHGRWEQPILQP